MTMMFFSLVKSLSFRETLLSYTVELSTLSSSMVFTNSTILLFSTSRKAINSTYQALLSSSPASTRTALDSLADTWSNADFREEVVMDSSCSSRDISSNLLLRDSATNCASTTPPQCNSINVERSSSSETEERRFFLFSVWLIQTPLKNLEFAPSKARGWLASVSGEEALTGDGILRWLGEGGKGCRGVPLDDRVVVAMSFLFLFFSLGAMEGPTPKWTGCLQQPSPNFRCPCQPTSCEKRSRCQPLGELPSTWFLQQRKRVNQQSIPNEC